MTDKISVLIDTIQVTNKKGETIINFVKGNELVGVHYFNRLVDFNNEILTIPIEHGSIALFVDV